MEGRESLGTFKVVIEVGLKTRDGGRRQQVANSHSRKTQRPSDTVASCGGPELRDGRRGTGSGRAEERRGSARNAIIFIAAIWKTGGTRAEGEKSVDKRVLVY